MKKLVKFTGDKLRCGQCLHFENSKNDSMDNLCKNLGIRGMATAPRCFTPNYPSVLKNPDEFVRLISYFSNKTAAEKKLLLAILQQKPKGKEFKLGQLVYVPLSRRDYISNYVAAYFVGYTSGKKITLAGSPSTKTRGSMFFAYLGSDELLLTPQEWKIKYKELLEKGKIDDPVLNTPRRITAQIEDDSYEVPTIDSAPKGKEILKKAGRFQVLEF
jgi:hypothetical protein